MLGRARETASGELRYYVDELLQRITALGELFGDVPVLRASDDVFASWCDNRRPEIRPDFADYGGAGFGYERERYFDAVLIEPNGLCFLKTNPSVWIGFCERRFCRIEFEWHRSKLAFFARK